MAKFRVEHTFKGISVEDYEKLYFDEDFNAALCEAVRLDRDVKKVEDDGKHFSRVVLVGPDRKLPEPMKKVLKTDRIAYEEHLDYDWGSYEGTWETIPNVMANKVETKGRLGFRAKGDDVLRWVEGEIKVKVLGVGGMIEKYIVGDVEKSYEDAARFTQKWIDTH